MTPRDEERKRAQHNDLIHDIERETTKAAQRYLIHDNEKGQFIRAKDRRDKRVKIKSEQTNTPTDSMKT